MSRPQLIELEAAVEGAVHLLCKGKDPKDFADTVLEVLAQRTKSETAVYWSIDSDLRRLRPVAMWKMSGVKLQTPEYATRYRRLSLSERNAVNVWRSKKPMCSATPALESCVLRALDARSQAGVWSAIKTDTTVYGVMELRQRGLAVSNAEDLLRVERMGYRLGYALEALLHGRADFR